MSTPQKIYVAGHRGMVGSAIVRQLQSIDFVIPGLTRDPWIADQVRNDKALTIAELAQAVSKAMGFEGNINFDPTQPDGSPRKLMDSTRLNSLGWQAKMNLEQGLALAYQDFMQQNGR